jgi:aspartyl-tRNA(Asn)/glutamyl-tRNA(Gln) amidotransferase subunit C
MKKSDVEHTAKLAKLKLAEAEVERFARELAPVLQHFEELQRLDTEGIEPLVTPSDIEYWMREDDVERVLAVDEAMANAPDRAGNLFRVPPVV